MLLDDFKTRYPNANLDKFTFVNDSYGGYIKWKVNGTTVMSNDDPTGKTWTDDLPTNLKTLLWGDLGLEKKPKVGSFPKSLTITNQSYSIPAINFGDFTTDVTKTLTFLDIYVSNNKKFTANMRNIFKSQVVTFKSAKQSKKWLNKPDFNYWPQQLNFAVWCATSGCGISLFESLNYPKVISSFIKFHIYFTIRRILYELKLPLPDEKPFSINNNPYNKVAYNKLCEEFGVSNNSDFRWKGGRNHGLGDEFIYYSSGGNENLYIVRNYDHDADTWPGQNKFSDEGYKDGDGNKISFIRNDLFSDFKYAWFIPMDGHGLTKAGLGRLNRSAEAFVYCILGAQVNTRNSIYGNGGGAIETQQEFLALFESSVIENDISKSIQNYQQSVQETKLRLDLAVAPGVWLMPSNMIINTESVVGYNNKLMKATEDMNFGVNNALNTETKTVGISHSLGSSKVSLPHKPETKPKTIIPTETAQTYAIKPENKSSQHEDNLIVFMVVGGAIAWYLFR